MTDLSYLDGGLTTDQGMREDLNRHVRAICVAWHEQKIEPAALEVASELLARASTELSDQRAQWAGIEASVAWLELPEPVTQFLRRATGDGLDATALAALAVHLLDLAEGLAVEVYVPELVALTARSDRSGDAARRVGTARYLRG